MANDKKKNILLIEDDGTLRALYVDIFEGQGFVVDQAVEGKEGLEKAKQGGYDLILLDILLPGIEGIRILEELKNNPPPIPNGPILMLTNQDQPQILDKCLSLGATGVIIKSETTPDQMVQQVKKHLEPPNQ